MVEVNQNSQMMRTQTRNDVSDSIIDFQWNAINSGLLSVIDRGNADSTSLTDDEKTLLSTFYVTNLRLWENIYYQYRNGLFEEAEFLAEREVWRNRASTPMFLMVYCPVSQAGALSTDFVQEIDSLMSSDLCAAMDFPLEPA